MTMNKKLKKFFTMKKQADAGFTLIELIVTIAIVAILAGVAVPAYNGYITKAERAADDQLLGDINKAFAAACMVEGIDNYGAQSASASLTAEKTVEKVTIDGEDITDTFNKFYEGGAFKKEDIKLQYVAKIGGFSQMADAYVTILNALLSGDYDAAIKAYQNSAYANIGYDVLAENIDAAAALISGVAAGDANSNFNKLLNTDTINNALIKYLGGDVEKVVDTLGKMVDDKTKELMAKDPTLTLEEASKQAENQIRANAAVLNAAENTAAVGDDFKAALKNGTAETFIKDNLASSDTTKNDAAVAQAAYAYGMYASYMEYSGKTVPEEVNLMDVYNVLKSDDFTKNYMTSDQATKDMAGYEGSMSLIVGGANNAGTNTVNDILMNGFNNDDLLGLMQNVTTKQDAATE